VPRSGFWEAREVAGACTGKAGGGWSWFWVSGFWYAREVVAGWQGAAPARLEEVVLSSCTRPTGRRQEGQLGAALRTASAMQHKMQQQQQQEQRKKQQHEGKKRRRRADDGEVREDEAEEDKGELGAAAGLAGLTGTAAGLAGLAADPTPGDWATARSSVVKRARKAVKAGEELVVAVCGAKGLGKSTFLRSVGQAVATVCANVWYLDTDLGQPECSVPGLVSLRRWGAEEPEHALFVGDSSPASHPVSYLDSCRELVRRHRGGGARAGVLLVNTHGWNIGLGAELVAAVCAAAGVHYLAHLKHASRPDAIVPAQMGTQLERTLALTGVVVSASYSPEEERFRRFARYFGASSLAVLEARPPLRVPVAGLSLLASVDAVADARPEPPSPADLVGAYAALCRRAPEGVLDFFALAIVRAAEAVPDAAWLLVLPPTLTPSSLRERADALVLGSQPVQLLRWSDNDSSAVAAQGHKPFFAFAHQCVHLADEARVNRKNLKRRRLLRRPV
jgi:hypothetical protein